MNTLADILERELWTSEDIQTSPELLNLVESNVIAMDEDVTSKVQLEDAGSVIEIPSIQESLYTEAEIMDDSGDYVTVEKINKVKVKAAVSFLSKTWGAKEMARQLDSGIDTVDAARSLVSRYWSKNIQERMVLTASGCIASNKANESSDNVLTDAANTFSYALSVQTLVKAGEYMDQFDTIAVHSLVYAQILAADAGSVTTILDSDLGIERKVYNGMELIVSDRMPIDLTAGTVTTIFFKSGAFIYADANAKDTLELDRDARIGKGGAETVVITRKGYLLHPKGYNFTKAAVAGLSARDAELADATNWERIIDAKQAPFVALESKI